MTKDELRTQALTKYSVVQPVAEWNKFAGLVLGLTRYSMQVRNTNEKPQEYTVFVEDDGGANEYAFVEGDPFADEPPAGFDFYLETKAQLDSMIADGTILGYVLGTVGERVTEVTVYRDIAGTKTKLTYLVWADDQDNIQYQDLGT